SPTFVMTRSQKWIKSSLETILQVLQQRAIAIVTLLGKNWWETRLRLLPCSSVTERSRSATPLN
ncbi:MAG: hypothetical protein RMY64_36945, partial [Nostoc sp. DedQUE08]|uniref:hypothetical protein n=1 Tax=Nostoc sp. DedQUE08 TaxID=3075393 RepID=UPI002AD33B09